MCLLCTTSSPHHKICFRNLSFGDHLFAFVYRMPKEGRKKKKKILADQGKGYVLIKYYVSYGPWL